MSFKTSSPLRGLATIVPMRILVVEDDRKVASFIQRGLEEEGHAVDVLYDGSEAGDQARRSTTTASSWI